MRFDFPRNVIPSPERAMNLFILSERFFGAKSTHLRMTLLGLASLVPYLIALGLGDLRAHTVEFVIAFFAAFILYLIAVALALRSKFSPTPVYLIAFFAILFRLILLPTKPTLSDDMFRYVWDGRVQAQGISPYRYPPDDKELSYLRANDSDVWQNINRKSSVTVYPPGTQLAFALMWRIVGDSVIGFKAIFVITELVGALLVIQLLRHFDLPRERILIYLWSPLLIFEVAHAGHVDALMMLVLIAAILFRIKERHWLGGAALGAAVLIKLFPLILLPALMPTIGVETLHATSLQRIRPTLKFLIAFAVTIILGYAPYLIIGDGAIGFLPNYFNENFNMGAARIVFEIAQVIHVVPSTFANAITFGGLVVLGIMFTLKSAASPQEMLIRCVWLIGWFTLTTQNLFSWYLLWLLPLIVLLIEPGKFLGFKFAPMTAWLIFSGTIMLSYLFFVEWRVNLWAQVAEYVPLYLMLGLRSLKEKENESIISIA